MASTTRKFDVVVIGGGINGAGIARDAAQRGLSVLLLEARDFGGATSSWSTRLIHGGLRYLEHGEISLVYESLHERRRLRRLAAHLVQPIRITIPIYRGGRRGRLLIRLGMLLYDLLSLGKDLPRHRMLSRRQLLGAVPGLNPEGLTGGASYYDAQVTYAERLVLENVIAAAADGAEVRNYSPATALKRLGAGGWEVRFRDRHADDERAVTALVVVNAGGPWVDSVLALTGESVPRLMGGTKGSHIVVGGFAGAPADALYVEARADGRPIFVVPWNGQYLIGTTDIRYDGDPADAVATDAEIDYLLAEANRVIPSAALTRDDINFTYAGIRPLPLHREGPEAAITRRHIIREHAGEGLISIIGGKLSTYRNLAEQAVDAVVKRSGIRAAPCRTRQAPLPGAVDLDRAARVLARIESLAARGRERLVGVYGGRVSRIAELIAAEPALGRALDRDGTVLAAEVALAVRDEFARALTDIVHRRTMLGLSPDAGAELVPAIVELASSELRWSPAEAERQLADLASHNARLGRARAA